jgi:quinol monooxygenase YgiN
MSDDAVLVFATFHPRPGKEDELLEVLCSMVGNTRAEPGCEVYDLYSSGDDAIAFHFFERYTDQAALQAHRDADYYKAYRTKVGDLLRSPIEVVVLREVDAKTAV